MILVNKLLALYQLVLGHRFSQCHHQRSPSFHMFQSSILNIVCSLVPTVRDNAVPVVTECHVLTLATFSKLDITKRRNCWFLSGRECNEKMLGVAIQWMSPRLQNTKDWGKSQFFIKVQSLGNFSVIILVHTFARTLPVNIDTTCWNIELEWLINYSSLRPGERKKKRSSMCPK